MGSLSLADNNVYPNFCLLASQCDSIFNEFKNNDIYTKVLEHVNHYDGEKYITEIKSKNFSLLEHLDKFKENDILGNPDKYCFEQPFNVMSPTTIRYIKVLYDLYELCGDLTDKDIVEIGAGYGGQCKIINSAFKFKQYNILDLREVNPLISKYLTKLNITNFNIIDFNNFNKFNTYLAISNYAFSECSKDIQEVYINKVLKNAEHGYMTCNFTTHLYNITSYSKKELILELSKYHKIRVKEEIPNTFANNIVITW